MPHAPGQLVQGDRGMEGGETVHASLAPRARPTGPDAGRVEREGAEEAIDVVGHAGLLRSRRALPRGQHLGAGGPQRGVLLVTQPNGHRANVAWAGTPFADAGVRFSPCRGPVPGRRPARRAGRGTAPTRWANHSSARSLSSRTSVTMLPVSLAPSSISRLQLVKMRNPGPGSGVRPPAMGRRACAGPRPRGRRRSRGRRPGAAGCPSSAP